MTNYEKMTEVLSAFFISVLKSKFSQGTPPPKLEYRDVKIMKLL